MFICTKNEDGSIPAACDFKAGSSFCYKECIHHNDIACPFCGEEDNLRQAVEVDAKTYACIPCESYFDLEEG
jgi:hypothetical protein